MTNRTGIDPSTLGWVKKELDSTLKHAADALESFTEATDDSTQLQFCVTHLHQVHGILQMLEAFGAGMLVEEMEQVAQALLNSQVSNQEDALEVLMRAIIQLSDYLGQLQSGAQDMPILLLPLMNDLRAARGAVLMSDSALFNPDLNVAANRTRYPRRDQESLQDKVRKLRHRYQVGLLGYLRNRGAKRGLEQMMDVLDELDHAASDDMVGSVWWAGAGMVEAIREKGLEAATAVKMLLGQIDRQMKRVIDDGEEAFAISLPRDLLRNLLYYVGSSEPVGERVPALQQLYGLKDLLLDEEQIEQARSGMFGPNTEILESVGEAIREDLAGVKDTLDLFVRSGGTAMDKLEGMPETLGKIADTLGVLGLGVPRSVVKQQISFIEALQKGEAEPEESHLMEVAESLLFVESSLDSLIKRPAGQKIDWVMSEESTLPEDRKRSEAELAEFEFRQVYGAALDEAVAEVGRAKESIVKFIETEHRGDVEGVGERFRSVIGALSLLDLDRAAGLLRAADRYVNREILSQDTLPDPAELDTLADVITSIEYYLEAVREGRTASDRILDVADSSLGKLGYQPGSDHISESTPLAGDVDFAFPEETAEAGTAGDDQVETAELIDETAAETDEEALETETATDQEQAEPASEAPAAPQPAAPVQRRQGRVNLDVPFMSDEQDPEILEIFLEEAEEVLETVREEYPKWKKNPDDQDALTTSRRMFHTLKGSGRLAGVLQLGELAWSIENLLNRILDNTVQPNEDVYDCIDRTVEVLPVMIKQVQGGPPPDMDVVDLMYKADVVADPDRRDELAALLGGAASAEVEPEPEPEQPAVEDEAELSADTSDETWPETAESESIEVTDVVTPDEEAEGAEEDESPEEITLEGFAPDEADQEQAVETGEELAESADIEVEEVDTDLGEGDNVYEIGGDESTPVGEDESEAPDLTPDYSSDDEQIRFDAPDDDFDVEMPDVAEPEEAAGEKEDDDSLGKPEAGADAGAEAETPEPEGMLLDPVLYEIFSNEANDHLAVVNAFLEADAREPREDLVRAMHTLTGSARMADIQPIATVGRRLEDLLNLRIEQMQDLTENDCQAMRHGCDLIRDMVVRLGEPGAVLPDIEPLLNEIAGLPEEGAVKRGTEDAAAATLDREDQHAKSEAGASEPAAPAEPEETPTISDDVDDELVSLFLEEAQDILEFLDTTVERWEAKPDHEASIAELHRSLHTLKGGARLAGFQGIGTLCHALEGVTNEVADHRVPADDRFFQVLHNCLERLEEMADEARQRKNPPAPPALLDELNEMMGGRGEAMFFPDNDSGADEELMEIFLEEAAEILESTEAALHAWIEDVENRDLITELQRALHTIKGGARMAGYPPIANLSHHMENLLIAVLSEKVPVNDALFALLEQVHDRLFAMRERAARHEALKEPQDLIDAIEAVRQGKQPSLPTEPTPVAEPKAEQGDEAAAAEKPKAGKKSAAKGQPPEAPRFEQPQKDERAQQEAVRVRADLLDNLVNYAGEVSIYRARLEQQVGSIRFNLTELDQTVERLRDQLRTMEIETEAQILYRFEREHEGEDQESFDPLELDRFSRMQELSRGLSESVNDLASIQGLLDHMSRESETLLLQQSRVNTELQDGLMRTRMVPFANLVPRMRRIVRQTCQEMGKKAQFKVEGAQGEMDRTVLERCVPPLEHMLRNAVAHGIENPADRDKSGKDQEGAISVEFAREGADVVIRVNDDGGGLNLDAIRAKAVKLGLMPENAPLSDREVMQFILESGFSTAAEVTQIAGRGVGMDVVNAEIKQLGGTLEIDSEQGTGTEFTIRLPFTLAINQALLCTAGEEAYAIPLSSIEGVVRMTHEELEHCFEAPHQAAYEYAGHRYEVRSLSALLGTAEANLPGPGKRAPIILLQTGDHRLALHVEGLMGNREIVVKSLGPQIATVQGIFGATILADGRVVLILDVSALVRLGIATQQITAEAEVETRTPDQIAADKRKEGKPLIMVVDDSITMRKVATRLLERNSMDVITAKDGVDAVSQLQESLPDAMLLDIEMPRMDGYELATHMRNDERLKDVPIIMITSRTGEKHRQRAMDIGVNRYLGKPYQESELLENLHDLLGIEKDRDG